MATTVLDVIQAFDDAASNSERGTRFEELMVSYFEHDPLLNDTYEKVTRWADWAHRAGTVDTGIDLVAQHRQTGEWSAIQCKFYSRHHVLQKKDIDSFFTASGKRWDGVGFSNRIIISTTDLWSRHAEDALSDQQIPVTRIGLEQLQSSPIDWVFADRARISVDLRPSRRYHTRPHQNIAIQKILAGFADHDRGQWISACGTGKTFTSLKLAEQLAADNDGSLRVLFLAPSIQLVAQTLREWSGQAEMHLRPTVVCSDTKASRAAEDIALHDLPLPATTDPSELYRRLTAGRRGAGLTVTFSTYQSAAVVSKAQDLGAPEFDLILCDEAHRTTGVTLAGETESDFVRVHDAQFLRARRRLYMTATPRLFSDAVKDKADAHSAVLTSMDDQTRFGPVFHRLGFGEAVEQNLLTDYKVLVLVVSEEQMAAPMQLLQAGPHQEIPLDDAAKIMGCWNSLAKRSVAGDPHPSFPPDAKPMKRAVAFLENIRSSQRVAKVFDDVVTATAGAAEASLLTCQAQHVDGTMNALTRADKLNWLKADVPDGECRILTNARCLSEGVDVPALDAVMFLSPRSSAVDVVQSVGRVMRRAPGKEFGYIILPVAVPVGTAPEQVLSDNRRFKVVWEVLNALRAHDDRFESVVQAINLNGGKDPSGRLIIDTPDDPSGTAAQLPLFSLEQWRDAIYSRIVSRVGSREYWDRWAADVAEMSAAQVARIKALLRQADAEVKATFEQFLTGLRGNLNDSISRDDAVSMLSQHLITAPVFDALFGGSGFAQSNPVSVGMQSMLDVLEGQGLDAETKQLERFYESVRSRAAAVTDAAGRQTVIHDLYEKFFKKAFPKQAESLGVVYTPVEVVDFILSTADELSRRHFGQGLTDEGVQVLDPFTGTGTFIVRLLESGIIAPEDLPRKYGATDAPHELWCNELMLLAYYIACVNIESTYESLTGSTHYVPFPGATLTDTFQISETSDRADTSLLPANNERITRQLQTPIQVIVGNPPYSVGQSSANDNNANLTYPSLDGRIRDTYAARSSATNKNNLYDSYIRSFRWATDRLAERGIVAFVANGGWLDGNTADGMRLSLADEFSELWVFNLRGNARTAGELRRQEGGNIFESGSRNTVAIVLGVKNPANDAPPPSIHYRDIGHYLSREEKLAILAEATLDDEGWERITPNAHGDWLTHRDERFSTFMPIGSKSGEPAIFKLHSRGLATSRDAWCYNFSQTALEDNVSRMIAAYNACLGADIVSDPSRVSWNRGLLKDHQRGVRHSFDSTSLRLSSYRPFTKQHSYFNRSMNDMVYRMHSIFPAPDAPNFGFYQVGNGSAVPFGIIALASIPDLHVTGAGSGGQFFPRWTYEPGPKRAESEMLFDLDTDLVGGYRRIDNITDEALAHFQQAFGAVTKDEIFSYVYAVLHSPQYRERFAADLKKMLPRIPLATHRDDFHAFAEAGQQLLELHIGYENVDPYPLDEVISAPIGLDAYELFAVTTKKMKFVSKHDRSTLIYNSHVKLRGIPEEVFAYQLGSRSALEWVMDRYVVKTDKASGIVNDPNDWSRDHGQPRYIIDLIGRVVRISLETNRVVALLPELPLD